MSAGAARAPTTTFGVIEHLLGFRQEPTRREDVEQALAERLRRRSCGDLEAYAALLADPTARAVESRALADRLTVNETYFFREPQHHDVLREALLPEASARGDLPIRILSLGCASGEEPYGLALTLLEAGFGREHAVIVACDASPAAIERADRAEYSEWSLRNVPEATRTRYFRKAKGAYVLDPAVRAFVRFEVRNVVDPDPLFWERDRFDVVFCRNMLIYLTPQVIRATIARLADVLRPGGHLFLGHSETPHAGPRFSVVHTNGAFYFRRRDERAAPPGPPSAHGWVEAIGRSTERLRSLEGRPTVERPEAPASAPRPSPVAAALEHFRLERFREALDCLTSAEPSEESTLLRAATLTNLGRLREAREACEACLVLDPACAGAHYLLGLTSEQLGDAAEARNRYARAAALDDLLAMPRLRGGILARRAGERDAARLLLREALRAFDQQEERAFVLFGGSLSRESLMSLCRMEIAACEGAR